MRKIRIILALCLCLALLAGAACAEEMHVLSTGEWDNLVYGCTLPDGRIVLIGSKTELVNNYNARGWILCLNPDLTVSWETEEGDESGSISANWAVLMPDGTIAVVFDRYTDEKNHVFVKTYTQDGRLTGKVFDIPGEYYSTGVTPSWLMLCRFEEKKDETVLVDWDGKELLRYDGAGMPGGIGRPVGNTDELVLVGSDRVENGHGKIVKLDGQTGKVLWETTLDWQLPDTVDAGMWSGIKTEDGGYMVLMIENGPDSETVRDAWSSFLVKFDAEGRMQWINGESFERDSLIAYQVFSYGGKTGVYCMPKQSAGRESFRPLVFRWFDADGKELGTTEVKLNLDDFPAIRHFLGWEPDERNPEPTASVEALIPAADGLWALGSCFVGTTDSEGIPGTLVDSYEIVMIRIPEP